jgi:hypothetical protein
MDACSRHILDLRGWFFGFRDYGCGGERDFGGHEETETGDGIAQNTPQNPLAPVLHGWDEQKP